MKKTLTSSGPGIPATCALGMLAVAVACGTNTPSEAPSDKVNANKNEAPGVQPSPIVIIIQRESIDPAAVYPVPPGLPPAPLQDVNGAVGTPTPTPNPEPEPTPSVVPQPSPTVIPPDATPGTEPTPDAPAPSPVAPAAGVPTPEGSPGAELSPALPTVPLVPEPTRPPPARLTPFPQPSAAPVVSPAPEPRATANITATAVPSSTPSATPTPDRSHCAGLKYGECFSLVIRFSDADIGQSPGLAFLSLALQERNHQSALQRACNQGLQSSLMLLHTETTLRGRVFGNIKRAHCVFQKIKLESQDQPKMSANEMGLSVRLVNLATEATLDPVAAVASTSDSHLALKDLQLKSSVREVMLHARPSDGRNMRWAPVVGRIDPSAAWGSSGVMGKVPFGYAVAPSAHIKIATPLTLASLPQRFANFFEVARKIEGLAPLRDELTAIETAIADASSERSPERLGGLLLASVNLGILEAYCTQRPAPGPCVTSAAASSSVTSTTPGSTSTAGNLVAHLHGLTLSAAPVSLDTKAAVMEAFKQLPFAALMAVTEQAHRGLFESAWNLPHGED